MRIALTAVLALAATLGARTSDACVIVGADGPPPKIAGEEVLIVWDSATQTEQLVRHLSFKDATQDFGFIVPTPAQPQLDEANDKIFDALYAVYRRRVPPTHDLPSNGPLEAATPSVALPVLEVEHKRVAGLDATVLLASDPAALAGWLTQHHYKTSPATSEYLRPYVSQHWYLTAFRYDPGQKDAGLHTRAVKLTFPSSRPFFPYAEPTDAPEVRGRVFRITVIGPERVRGELGDQPWPTFPSYAGKLHGAWRESQRNTSTPDDAPADRAAWDEVLRLGHDQGWMTTFDERSQPRGQSDLYFQPDPKTGPVRSGIEDKVE